MEKEEKAIGYLWFERSAWESCEVSVAIDQEYQSRGYGKEALSAAISQLSWGVEVILAKIREDNPASIGFFRNSGFEYTQSKCEGIVVMRKLL